MTNAIPHVPDNASPAAAPVPLDVLPAAAEAAALMGQQLAFYRSLAEKDGRLAAWYLGARITLATPSNPERLVQAAHSIREMMNNLHSITDVPAKAATGGLGDKFAVMTGMWERAQRMSGCYLDGCWAGEIDDAARRGFEAVETAIEWQARNRPRRAEVHRSTLRGLDVSGRTLPSWIEDTHISLWNGLLDFFVKVCHHGRQTDDTEFVKALEELERFVLDRLKPRTFAEQETLDRLIEEAEHGA